MAKLLQKTTKKRHRFSLPFLLIRRPSSFSQRSIHYVKPIMETQTMNYEKFCLQWKLSAWISIRTRIRRSLNVKSTTTLIHCTTLNISLNFPVFLTSLSKHKELKSTWCFASHLIYAECRSTIIYMSPVVYAAGYSYIKHKVHLCSQH